MWQYIEEREASVDFASNGVQVKKPLAAHVSNLPPPELRRKKGAMDGRFSRSSALNLRRKLACLPSETFRLWGATLTMPAQCYLDPSDFRYLFNTFCKDITFRLNGVRRAGYSPDIGFLWRLELTTGENNEGKVRTPHLHCVVWTNVPSDLLQFSADWCAAVERHFKLPRGSLDPQVAAQVCELTSCQQAFQYVANHTSKHKEAQLGWPGRQWGIYYGTRANRAKMSPILNRFDKKNLAKVKQEEDLTDEEREILAHGNCKKIKEAGTKNGRCSNAVSVII